MMLQIKKIQLSLLRWKKRQRKNNVLPFILSIAVGLIVGLGAISVKMIIHLIEHYAVYFAPNFFYFFLPLLGLLIVTMLNHTLFRKIAFFSGSKSVIESIELKSSKINFRNMYTKFITTGITIGFGGSSGVEAAIITSGAAVGSNVGSFMGLGYRLRTLLIGCGISAGIAAIYNAPMGGFIFALEVIIPEFTATLLIPLLVAAVSGKVLFEAIMGSQLRFEVPLTQFNNEQIPLVILLGIAGMLMSKYILIIYKYCSKYLSKIKSPYMRAIVGGLSLGSIIFLFPATFGEGYVGMNAILHLKENSLFENSFFGTILKGPWIIVTVFFLLTLVKPLATGICVSSGGEGGYFAPSLVTGGLMGFLFYKIMVILFPEIPLSHSTFIFLGMASVFACVMNAPVTSIFLVAEITQSYQLFVPLMIVSAVSYFTKYYWENLRRGVSNTKSHEKALRMDRFLLNQIMVKDLTEKNHLIVMQETPLREVIENFSKSPYDILPVLDNDGFLKGLISLSDIRMNLGETMKYETLMAEDVMHTAEDQTISIYETAYEALKKFDNFSGAVLPVVAKGKLAGVISKNKLLSEYRRELTRANRFFS